MGSRRLLNLPGKLRRHVRKKKESDDCSNASSRNGVSIHLNDDSFRLWEVHAPNQVFVSWIGSEGVGCEIFFFSPRPGSMLSAAGAPSFDIWVATRDRVDDPWDTPVPLDEAVNSPFTEANPQISADGLTLYFGSTRPTLDTDSKQVSDCGGFDLYMSTRTKLKGKDRQD